MPAVMTIEDIEKAIARLPSDQLAEFRAWFEEFDAARFDQKQASPGLSKAKAGEQA